MPTNNLKRHNCYNLAFLLALRYASAFILIGYTNLCLSQVGVLWKCSNVWMDRAAFRHGVF